MGIATPLSANSQGVIDLAVTEDEKFVYVQNAVSGTVDGFRFEANGAHAKATTAEGLPAFDESGMEGIAPPSDTDTTVTESPVTIVQHQQPLLRIPLRIADASGKQLLLIATQVTLVLVPGEAEEIRGTASMPARLYRPRKWTTHASRSPARQGPSQHDCVGPSPCRRMEAGW
ncbi:hypothetical protein [Streptomyces umbrinus]|uniref:hypothetical protein n=1 Tax=Streptomyces umbrinus TaxID=67370 RepID=UPI00342FA248